MNKRLIELIKEEFDKKLAVKTGWGRNEIKQALNESITDALATMIDLIDDKKDVTD